jgi:predicted type IV restriction endonuclease
MEEIQQVVLRMKNKISKHRKLYERNEEAVKQQILSEIFESLGWDWKNPDEVRPEDKTSQGRADYALLVEGNIIAFVEAKRLGIDILTDLKPLEQLGGYCFAKGVKYGILTNGVQWRAIKSYEEGKSIEERELFSVDLEKEPTEKVILKLSFLKKDRIKKLEELARALKMFEESSNILKQHGISGELLAKYISTISKTEPSKDFPPIGSELLRTLQNVSWTKPVRLYVNENGARELSLQKKTWREALLTFVRYLVEEKKIPSEKLVIPKYITTDPSTLVHRGKPSSYKQIGDVFVEIWLSANNILKVLKELEKRSGIRIAVELLTKK